MLSLAGADGFLSAILPGGGLELDFDLLAGWSSAKGLLLRRRGGTRAIDIPVDFDLGPIKHPDAARRPGMSRARRLTLERRAPSERKLGPFAHGRRAAWARTRCSRFPAGGGNLGAADLDFAFKPPSGIGLSPRRRRASRAAATSFLDPDKGEYAGVLELAFGPVSIKAIGILTTKLPGGGEGWALLLLVFGEFAAVQLGFGFTLNGVGGIIGLQHGVSIDACSPACAPACSTRCCSRATRSPTRRTLIGQLRVVFPIVPRALTSARR